jgi:hypothetical protein
MVSDLNIWRAANQFMKQHGDEAAPRAEFMAEGFAAMGSFDGREPMGVAAITEKVMIGRGLPLIDPIFIRTVQLAL